jgi:hypothetical protein
MNTELQIETLINIYFSPKNDYKRAAVNRAYRDLNRTLPLKEKNIDSQITRDNNKNKVAVLIIEELNCFLKEEFNESDFNKKHKEICETICKEWSEITIGHAQKWINITLNYWYVMGTKFIPGIVLNHKHFHVPIDRIMLNLIYEKYNQEPWSKISSYDTYLNHQTKFREKFVLKNQIPILREIEKFNKAINS